MSWQPAHEPSADAPADDACAAAIETTISPKTRDLGGGFTVRRVLPAMQRRTVGPFVFFDQMGPLVLESGGGLDVRPHPHIGLATVTYLFAGEIIHRDSLGTVQAIRPGDVNWMIAGRGITHSERSPAEARLGGAPLSGIQLWVALPRTHEETEPAFAHHGVASLPLLEGDGARLRVIAGRLSGAISPVATLSDLFYADLSLAAGASFALAPEHEERAAYPIEGEVEIAGAVFGPGQLLAFRRGAEIVLRAVTKTRLLLLGGAPLDGQRHLWWNFVSSSSERLEQAKADWKAGRFPPVPGETELIPLPE